MMIIIDDFTAAFATMFGQMASDLVEQARREYQSYTYWAL